jgi:CubicO group peptidase (beta-lactamase class C family)
MSSTLQQSRKRPARDHLPGHKKRRLVAGCQVVPPEAGGLSRAPLNRLRAVVHKEVHELGSLPGVAHLILKDGRCVFKHAAGWSDIKRRKKFDLRTLCALHSCSKPLTVAAFLTLVDAGKVRLADPIDKYLPFSQEVVAGKDKSRTRKVKTRPTLRDLLSMIAGLRYGDDVAYKEVMSRLRMHKITDLSGLCDAVMKVPLQSEPRTMHYYSLSVDILGRICEIVSGKALDEFMTERLLKPLGMVDTHFVIPSSKLRRTSLLYDCKRVPARKRKANANKAYRAYPWTSHKMHSDVLSGGGGLLSYCDAGIYSTVEDYARFCQMLLSGGKAASGRQVLSASTVRMLWQDGLTPYAKKDGRVSGWNDYGGKDPSEKFYWDHHAWSLLNATLDLEEGPKKAGPPRRGNTLWMYGMGAYWFIDARRKIVAVSFAQCFSSRGKDRGSDCVPFMKAAVDEGSDKWKGKLGKEKFYGKEGVADWLKDALP